MPFYVIMPPGILAGLRSAGPARLTDFRKSRRDPLSVSKNRLAHRNFGLVTRDPACSQIAGAQTIPSQTIKRKCGQPTGAAANPPGCRFSFRNTEYLPVLRLLHHLPAIILHSLFGHDGTLSQLKVSTLMRVLGVESEERLAVVYRYRISGQSVASKMQHNASSDVFFSQTLGIAH